MARVTAVCMLLGAVGAGCSAGGYTVVVRFEPASIATDVSRVELALVPSCAAQGRSGEDAVGPLQTLELRRGVGPRALGDVAPGTYGLYARAWSATCRVVAAACKDVTLVAGGEGELVVTAVGLAGPTCPLDTTCRDGTCLALDGGLDAAVPDGGGPDAGGPPDAGPGLDAASCAPGSAPRACFADVDVDGFAAASAAPVLVCVAAGGACPTGTTDVAPTASSADCDDAHSTVHPGAPESCNGADDDCDPATLDGAAEPTLGMPCDGADADLCNEGTRACIGATLACTDATGDVVETCNGVDDDCDGEIDDAPACPDGCTGVVRPATGSRYMFCSGARQFALAGTACAAQRMRLVRLDDAGEDAWALATATPAFGGVRYWIGGTDVVTEGEWQWMDGTLFWSAGGPVTGAYANWAPGQPSGGVAEACADARPDMGDHWGDADCTLLRPFVCEAY